MTNTIKNLNEALDILKAKNPDTAYAVMTGYLMAFASQDTANRILKLVEEKTNDDTKRLYFYR